MTIIQHEGLITSAFGRHYQLELDDHTRLLAHPRGKKSDAVVGDRVIWQASQDEAVVDKIVPRRNLFYRQDEMRTKAFAANIDQIVLMIAAEPEFSSHQLNRTLIAAQAQDIDLIIVLNKADLDLPFSAALKRMHPYLEIGCKIVKTSMRQPETIPPLKAFLQNKVSLILGPSGSGKSTLINALIPDAQAQTREIS
ncbi:MAG: ribosome small subunit-dependent GTPase A, partial [Saezia sp.]